MLHLIACFTGGAFLINTIPHLVAGVSGRAFQSPFASPSGEGLSSSTVNVLWGFFNLAAALTLLRHAALFGLPEILATGAGGLALALFAARHFGRFHGGNNPHQH